MATQKGRHEDSKVPSKQAPPECFVAMPLSDPEGYSAGHFNRVFKDILEPACNKAGYAAIRASDVQETNLIHLDVLQRLLNSPMVLVDLSARNPNVLFELGLRQAFDKPVVLVQEVGTPKIFDIAPLRYTEYRSALLYHEVLEDQEIIARALVATRNAGQTGAGVNSVVRILSLTRPASLPEVPEASRDPTLELIRAELSELRSEVRKSQRATALPPSPPLQRTEPVILSEESRRLKRVVDALDAQLHSVTDPANREAVWSAIGSELEYVNTLTDMITDHYGHVPLAIARERERLLRLEVEAATGPVMLDEPGNPDEKKGA